MGFPTEIPGRRAGSDRSVRPGPDRVRDDQNSVIAADFRASTFHPMTTPTTLEGLAPRHSSCPPATSSPATAGARHRATYTSRRPALPGPSSAASTASTPLKIRPGKGTPHQGRDGNDLARGQSGVLRRVRLVARGASPGASHNLSPWTHGGVIAAHESGGVPAELDAGWLQSPSGAHSSTIEVSLSPSLASAAATCRRRSRRALGSFGAGVRVGRAASSEEDHRRVVAVRGGVRRHGQLRRHPEPHRGSVGGR